MVVRIDFTKEKGRGVFAARHFAKGELIERAPVHVLSMCQFCYIVNTFLINYCFVWGDEMAVAFGTFFFLNHSYSPNAQYVKRLDDRIIELFARRDIEAGEEILDNYNGDPEDDTPLWFEVKD
jgi:SET domain-containing protein